ncbi:transposable element Tcb2 transposase [Trichonephila clavipes]|uniref:Transposable element Tcb2 transposase n=1 Tax=Trichonephila clavipes TaxID=2585209 RepID=A0A8X6STL7_TRICX|nr:transposable element Tcb2 transposase [Trichonephila clavipes]
MSRFTVARRLHKGGLFARRPERCLPLKVDHRRHRFKWCREHKNWTTDQWSRVLFTDESRFSTRSDSREPRGASKNALQIRKELVETVRETCSLSSESRGKVPPREGPKKT